MGVVCGSHTWGTPVVACPIPSYRYVFCRRVPDGDDNPTIESIQVIQRCLRRGLYCNFMANVPNCALAVTAK